MNFRPISAAFLAITLSVAPLTLSQAPSLAQNPGKLKFNLDFAKQTITDSQVQSAISAIDKLAEKQIQDGKVPGMAISVVFNDKMVFAKGYGVRETGKNDKIDSDTVFQLASISKPVGATVVAAAVGEKVVSWDSKINDLDPSFALSEAWVTKNLTIRDLYAHRSGLPAHSGDILEDIGYDRAQCLHRLRYQKPASSMRANYAYTNFGMTEGGVAVAKAANMRWEKLSEEKLYKPLGMSSTTSKFDEFWSRQNKALGHMLVNGKWVYKKQRNPDAQSPAGGVSSSVTDMAKWMRLQIETGKFDGKQIVDEKALQEVQTPQMVTGKSPLNGMADFYGLGMNVSYDKHGRLILGHSGAFALGAGTNVKMIPAEKLGVCVLTNGAPVGVAEGMASTFTDLALYGKESQDWLSLFGQIFADPATLGEESGAFTKPPKNPQTSLKNSAYIGTYNNDFFGPLKITETSEGLSISIGKNVTKPMKHFDRDSFTYEMETENLFGNSGITFAIGADGKATSVLVENLNNHGQGLFTREE